MHESLLRTSQPGLDDLMLDLISLEYHETVLPAAGHRAEGRAPHGDEGERGQIRAGVRTELRSDSAALNGMVAALLERLGRKVHVQRDPTRGGGASAVNEVAASVRVDITLRTR